MTSPLQGSHGATPAMPGLVTPDPSPALAGGLWAMIAKSASGGGSGSAQASASTLNAAGRPNDREAVVGGERSVLPLLYGEMRIGATIALARNEGQALHLLAVWSEGEIDAVSTLQFGEKSVGGYSGITYRHYLGTADQIYVPELHAAWDAYDGRDDLRNVAYTWIKLAGNSDVEDPFTIRAVVRGIKVYDPRTGFTAWSSNPALILADFMANERYGRGRGFDGIDWDSVAICADTCDDLVNSKPRRTLNLFISQALDGESWQETLRAYAGVILYESGGKLFMVPDRPRDTDHVLDDSFIVKDSLSISWKREEERPDLVEVVWTDAPHDYREATARAQTSVDAFRLSRLYLPGIIDGSEAYRFAMERLNHAIIACRSVSFVTKHHGLKILPGDVISLTHGERIVSALFRVLSSVHTGPGQYAITAEAYDQTMYSDAVAGPVDFNDPGLADPDGPPAITGLTLSETSNLSNSGVYRTDIVAEWDDAEATYPFVRGYEVSALAANFNFPRIVFPSNRALIPIPREGQPYSVSVWTVSTTGARAPSVTAQITPRGYTAPPADVSGFTSAKELGGKVYLQWPSTTGATFYHLKRGAVTDTWATATSLTSRHDALTFLDADAASGAYRYFIKAVGVNGVESANDANADVTVVASNQYQLLDSKTWTLDELTLTKFTGYRLGNNYYAITDNNEDWDEGYTGDNWDSDGRANVPWCLPRTTHGGSDGLNDTITVETDPWQFSDSVIGGQFSVSGVQMSASENGGTAGVLYQIGLSEDGSTWAWHSGLNVVASGKHAKVKISDRCDGVNAALRFQLAVSLAIALTEITDEFNVSCGTTQPESVEYTKTFSAIKDGYPKLTVLSGSTPALAWADNVDASGFDLYCTDLNGSAVARTVGVVVKGV